MDGAARRLGLATDTLGRPKNLTRFDVATGGAAVNQVRRLDNGLSQIVNAPQAHSGMVGGWTPVFGMTYSEMNGGANSRHAA